MATYYEINGQKVQNLASDPSPLAEGQVWYNTTSSTAKVAGYSASGAWSSANALPTVISGNAGGGSTNAGLSIAGGTGPTASYSSAVNKYDGTNWTSTGTLPFTFALGGAAGPQTANIAGGGDGNAPGVTATFNGTSWTSKPGFGGDAYQIKMVGDSGTAFAVGSYYSTSAYNWDGSTWTSSPAAPVNNYNLSGAGTKADASFVGGSLVGPGAASNIHMNWDGSGWSNRTVTPLSGATGGQSSNSAPASNFWVTGFPPSKTATLLWDGSSWSTQGSMSVPRNNGAGDRSSASVGFIAGGQPNTAATEEWNGAGVSVKTITAS